jgi:hypothetical protein
MLLRLRMSSYRGDYMLSRKFIAPKSADNQCRRTFFLDLWPDFAVFPDPALLRSITAGIIAGQERVIDLAIG